MSEATVAAPVVETAPVAAPEAAPQAPVDTQGVPQTPAATQGPQTRTEASHSAASRARATYEAARARSAAAVDSANAPAAPAAAPTLDANGRPHSPDNGQFLAAASAAVGTEPPATTQADLSAQPAAMPQVFRVPIPEGHSLREQGLEFIDAHDTVQERAIRAALNSETRRREVDAARQEAQQYQRQLLQYRAWVDAQQQFQKTAMDAGIMAQYEALREVDEVAAERFWRGAQLEMQADAEQRYAAATEEVEQQHVQQTAQQFVQSAYESLASRVPSEVSALPEFTDLYRLAVRNYGDEVSRQEQMGIQVEPSEEGLSRYLQGALLSNPRVIEVLSRKQQEITNQQQQHNNWQYQQQIEQIRQEAIRNAQAQATEAERQRIAAASLPMHPVARLGHARHDLQSTSAQPEDPTRGLTGNALQRTLVQSVRARAAQYGRR